MVVVVTYIRWRKGVKLPRLKMSPTIVQRIVLDLRQNIGLAHNIKLIRESCRCLNHAQFCCGGMYISCIPLQPAQAVLTTGP
jgi:hypothetical protein